MPKPIKPENPNLTPLPYKAYLVRLWRDSRQADWRASAQSVQSGETVRFASLKALFAFLEKCATEKAAPENTAKK